MKKLFSIFMAFFLMYNISFASVSAYTDCAEYAENAIRAEEDHYGEMSDLEWVQGFSDYWYFCDDAYGNIADPVFL